MNLPELLIQDRDARAYELKKAGLTFRQIAKVLNVSDGTAHASYKRAISKLNQQLVDNHREWLTLQVDRLEHMISNLWPQTIAQKIPNPDGTGEITIPPNLDAIDRILKIIAQESKYMGIDGAVKLEVSQGNSGGPRFGPQAEGTGEITPEDEVRGLLRVMVESGVFDQNQAQVIRRAMGETDIVDAEVVEEEGQEYPALDPGGSDEDDESEG